MTALLAALLEGHSLSEEESHGLFSQMMEGELPPVTVSALLVALRMKGETVDELTGAARAMRAKARMIQAPPHAIDTCGTGGDAQGTYNVSTAAAIVAAACGIPVAKHGNSSISSRSGSADVLAALGVNLQASLPALERALRETGLCFLLAPNHHQAMKHVAPVRRELKVRTIFNLLGPLSNPAGVRHQIVGVYDAQWVRPLAEVLDRLGAKRAWVVHGHDGMDELTTTAASHVAELDDGEIREFDVTPEEAGLGRACLVDIQGGSPEANAAALMRLLEGEPSAYRDIVLLNSAAALRVAGRVESLAEGVEMAARAIDCGAAKQCLMSLVQITQNPELS